MTDSPYSEQPAPQDLKKIAADFATARRLFADMAAADQEGVAEGLRRVEESGRGASVLLAACQLGLEFARTCESANLLRDDEGPLTLQVFLDSSALNQLAAQAD
ncbi:hypothetical protein A5634_18140 [Mycobacterium asiaticum]|uniref:Uncharacterized protein n=1 Tax=Mycobacterium asiaticum TaxID=1790 RepID=A0A1A3P5K9_MYCAS|nr:hypothetical protein [Mycobacterium asiaticum]OBK29528.1 hypothetical protein A5634_18140 [Mycobacterium asiaticum]